MVSVGILLAIVLSRNTQFHEFLVHLDNFGYLGAFISGIFFVSTFTVATSALMLSIFAKTLSPIEIGVIAGVGAVVGDIIIFHFIKDDLYKEIKDIYKYVDKKKHLQKLFHTKYFNWLLPIIGAIIIASPLPDELGVSLIGLTSVNIIQFIILSFFLNSFGIFLVIFASNLM